MSDKPESPEEKPEEGAQQPPETAEPGETVEVPAPGTGEQAETSRLQRKKLSLRQDATSEVSPEETAVAPGPGDTQGNALVDPTRRRDTNTASLRRLRPQNEVSADADADPDNTETVNIKVIKEQKKQFRNMMTSSQTLRVKPEDAAQAPSIAATPSAQAGDEAPAAGGGDEPKRTLKIKAPGDAETRTESISRPGMAMTPDQTAETPAQGGQHSPKSTLKIKAPPGVAPAQAGGSKPGATLKIKAPAPAAAQTQQAPAPAPGQTVRQEAPKKGKTLKLRSGQPAAATTARQKPRSRAAAPAVEEEDYEEVDAMAVPGWGYAIPSAATIILCLAALFKIIMSSKELFDGSFF